jgi:hypothetical protein
VRNRSRLTLLVLAIVMALVLSSCWQIRRVGVNKWQITVSERATVTLDLAKASPENDQDGYPFVMAGFTDGLRNAGKKWDVQGNFGGPETGVKDNSLKQSVLNGDAICNVGSATFAEFSSGYSTWIALRTSNTIDLATAGDDEILRFKHSLGVAAGATVPSVQSFFYVSGIWVDDGDLVAEPGEVLCQSSYNGSMNLVAP